MFVLGFFSALSNFMTYRMKTIFAVLFVAALCCAGLVRANKSRLWRDTIYRSDVQGVVVLPSGQRFPTNQWVATGHRRPLSVASGPSPGEFLLINRNNTEIAVIEFDGRQYAAVIQDYTLAKPNYVAEFWLRLGDEVESNKI